MRLFVLPGAMPTRSWHFFSYATMMFFLTIADAIMSYLAPVIMQHALGATVMGLILSTSSMAGVVTDFTLARLFGHQRAAFFTRLILIFVFAFPLSFLFFHSIAAFLVAMLAWGIYYEAIVFSNYHAVHELVNRSTHAWAWGALATVRSVAYVIGPLVAGAMTSIDVRRPLWLAVIFYGISVLLFAGQQATWRGRRSHPVIVKQVRHQHTFKQELFLWRTYGRVLWPLLSLTFIIVLIDATFFSIGPVFGEYLAQLHGWGGLFITMYTVPSVLMGMLVGVLARPIGKKRMAFLAGILAGLSMIVMSQLHAVPLILFTTFLSSCALAIMFPELSATYQDYMARSPHSGNDLIGLAAIASSSAYILGPMLSGWLSDHIGAVNVFGLWGGLLVVVSILALLVVPRKIRIPQYELARVLRRRY